MSCSPEHQNHKLGWITYIPYWAPNSCHTLPPHILWWLRGIPYPQDRLLRVIWRTLFFTSLLPVHSWITSMQPLIILLQGHGSSKWTPILPFLLWVFKMFFKPKPRGSFLSLSGPVFLLCLKLQGLSVPATGWGYRCCEATGAVRLQVPWGYGCPGGFAFLK